MSATANILQARPGPSVEAILARRLRAGRGQAGSIPRRGTLDPAPLSFPQQRLWFLDQMDPGSPLYNVPSALRLAGPLDLPVLERAFTQVLRRHEVLRTTFTVVDGAPVQVLAHGHLNSIQNSKFRLQNSEGHLPRPFHLTMVDLQNRTPSELEQELAWRLTAEARRPFDLQRDLMMRATVFRLGPREHVLLVTMHHIASDAWSIGILFEELAAFYNAFLDGQRSPLKPLPIQYADFAIWQRQAVSGPLLEKQLAYWREKLANAPEAIELPYDRASSIQNSEFRIQNSEGATRSALLPASLMRALQQASQQNGVTLFILLLAAFKVLLHRYSGQTDLLVGSPVAGRGRVETEPLIGFFLNTLVLRSDLDGDPTFLEALARIRDVSLEAFAHQDLPFEKLVQDLQPDRRLNRTPLFQVMFTSIQNSKFQIPNSEGNSIQNSEFRIQNLEVEPIEVDLGLSPFDLTLFTEETPRGLNTAFEYRSDLFQAQTIERLLGAFRVLLEGIVADPRRRISQLPLLPPVEERRILDEWSHSQIQNSEFSIQHSKGHCVHELISEQAGRTPDAIAVAFGQVNLTYRQLNDRAEQLARRLTGLGLGPEGFVAIGLERSPEMIVGLLGILKAGAAYLPLDPAEPRERLSFKLKDSAATVLLTQRRLLNALPPAQFVLCLDEETLAPAPAPAPALRATPQNLAYVIYTSGSTGAPKGVLVEHAALASHSLGFAKQFELHPGDRVLQFAPLSFDVSAEEIFPALLSGATLVLRPDFLSASVKDFGPFLTREKITVVNIPTPYWNEWLNEMPPSKSDLPPALRLVIVGSDSVSVDQFRLWRQLAGDRIRWCNGYGLTEATITSTFYEPSRDEEVPHSVPVGRPAANARVYILDPAGKPVPVGVRGELYLGGAGIARGYLNQPELTAEKFLPDPFDARPNARMVRTGDLARWRHDGNIEFLGRADDQVKIRGFRIELGEIESLLLQHDAVRDAVVVAREDAGQKRLVAYVVPRSEAGKAKPSEPALGPILKEFLKAKLPAYMIPSAIVELAALPLLPSGKVARKSLPQPEALRAGRAESFMPASDALEEQLVRIWAGVLQLDTVGIHDNFFDLGGHSLLAVKLGREIEKLTGRNLPLVHLFHSPTIAELAKIIRTENSPSGESPLLPIQEHGSRPPLFLVHGAGGGMLWGYANLARYLSKDQPVYAFNSRGMNGQEEFATVEEIARSYVDALLAFRPDGPFYLGGYCFGGELAFEMAQQLSARGHRVALLAMFNAMPPNSSFERLRLDPLSLAKFAWNACRWLNYFRQWTPEQRRLFLQRKMNLLRKGLKLWSSHEKRTVEDISAEDWIDVSDYADYQRRLWDVHLRASARYVPRPYAGHITVFRTRIHPFLCSFDPASGWSEFAGSGVTVKVMPGAHESILDEPHVQTLANELDKCLLAAQPVATG